MNRRQLEHLCKCRSTLSGIPIRLYENGHLVYCHEAIPFSGDICKYVYPLLLRSEKSNPYVVLNNMNAFGLIRVNHSPFDIVLGPSKSAALTQDEMKEELLSLGFDSSLLIQFKQYLSAIPEAPINYFFLLLSEVNLYVNNEVVQIYDFINMNSDIIHQNICEANESLIESFEKIKYDEAPKHTTQAFEEQMLFFIKNGQTEKLIKLFDGAPGKAGKLASNRLRQDKNNAIVSLTLATRAAIAGSLNPETAYLLSDYYIQKIESSMTSNEVLQINATAIIYLCNRVKDLNCHKVNSPIVDLAIKYITDNITQKLTINDIAKKLYVSRNHLSTTFKNETGINLIDYIALQKIIEAKRLIRYTDKSLSEISNYLAYSSQSYFQNQFKKITGLTPMSYRKDRFAE